VVLVDVTTAPSPGTPTITLRFAKALALASPMGAAGFFILMNIYGALKYEDFHKLANFATGHKEHLCTVANYFSHDTMHEYLSTEFSRAISHQVQIFLSFFPNNKISQIEIQLCATMCRKQVPPK
jgi:hypothetical protein